MAAIEKLNASATVDDRELQADAPTFAPPVGHPRFPLVDAVRAIAAFLVVGHHIAFIVGRLDPAVAAPLAYHLQVGVPVFFAISGFLLYRPFVATRHGARPRPVKEYFRNRALRIVPGYWVALTLAAVYPGLVGVFTGEWWAYYGFLQVYTEKRTLQGLGVAWTLCIEMTFYLLLPLYAWVLARLAGTRRHWLAIEIAVLGVLAAASILACWETRLLTIVVTFAWFAVGMAFANVSVATRGRSVPRWAALAMWVGAVLTYVALSYVLAPDNPLSLGDASNRALYTAFSAAFAALVLGPAVFSTAGLPARVLSMGWLAWLGLVSYGIYLYHVPVLLGIQRLRLNELIPNQPILSYVVVGVPTSIALGALSYYLIERPALRLKLRANRRVASRE